MSRSRTQQVLLAGVPCTVISATVFQLVCRPGATNASTPVFNSTPNAPVWDKTAGPAAFTGRMWPGGRGLLHTVFGDFYDWYNLARRSQNAWPAPGTTPLVQYVDTDSVSGFSWQEVRAWWLKGVLYSLSCLGHSKLMLYPI